MLSNNKCNLRPLVLDDVTYLNKWNNDEDLNKYLGNGFYPVSIDTQKEWIKNMIDCSKFSTNKRYMIETLDHEPIGLVGLYNINFINKNCEIGIYIGEKEYQSKGYASNAIKLIIEYAKNYLNIFKVKAFVTKSNEKAVKFWTKIGFMQKGLFEKERFIDGELIDLLIFEFIIN